LAASLPSTKFSFIVKLLSTFLSTSSAIQRQVPILTQQGIYTFKWFYFQSLFVFPRCLIKF
jgi:hypothetical protein